ncbi:MAG: DUF5777 family beta-barrel protein [Pyrinomonadaceae bacterium]
MFEKFLNRNSFQRNFLLLFSVALIVGGWTSPGLGQTATASAAKPEAAKTEPSAPSAGKSDIKVIFDEAQPGVLFVESNGEKIRIDANGKTVEKLAAATDEPVEEAVPNSAETADPGEAPPEEQEEESAYDFDPGFEPFDYRLINVPTPRKVPKGTWNMSFTHRFSQPLHPFGESGKALLGFDSFSASGFGISYGITDKLYVNVYRSPLCQKGLCRTVEVGFGYHWTDQNKKSPIALTTYASVEGNDNFTEEYTYNFQAMLSHRIGKRVYLFFSPAVHLNANGQHRFNPRPEDYFPPAEVANTFKLPTHGASFGMGTAVMITPTLLGLFEFTPRTGFKLGRVDPVFDQNFNVVDFNTVSYPEIGFGIQKNIGKHSFTLTFSNTQTTTTSRYNSSNILLKPRNFVIGFNLFRRW